MRTISKAGKQAKVKKLEAKMATMTKRYQTSTANIKARIAKLKAA